MRFIVPVALLLAALIHALPVFGLLSASKLETLYGIPVREPNLELLLRHRAVLFGLLAAFLTCAAFRPDLHRLALVAGFVSVCAFLVLAWLMPSTNAALTRVVWADLVALVALIVAALVRVLHQAPINAAAQASGSL
jgi:hypothetical protein